MSREHKEWAATHSWFVEVTEDGVRVEDIVLDLKTREVTTIIREIKDFQELLKWAGY